jgi:hypothetical protein
LRIRSWVLGIIVIVFIFGGIFASSALGYWQTKSSGEYKGGKADVEYNEENLTSETIVGKTTFQDLINWGVSVEDIEEVIGEEFPNADTIIRDYASQKGLEFSVLKSALQEKVNSVNR